MLIPESTHNTSLDTSTFCTYNHSKNIVDLQPLKSTVINDKFSECNRHNIWQLKLAIQYLFKFVIKSERVSLFNQFYRIFANIIHTRYVATINASATFRTCVFWCKTLTVQLQAAWLPAITIIGQCLLYDHKNSSVRRLVSEILKPI